MERSTKTGLGVSKQVYRNEPEKPKVKGEVQGKGDVASLWAMTSSHLLTAHGALYQGANLPGIAGGKGIVKNNDAYVDDVDTFASSMENGIEVAGAVCTKLTQGAQAWSNVQDVVAASTAFHKCLLSILSYKNKGGSLTINYDYKYSMYLYDVKGAPSLIKMQSPDKPNDGLGFRHAPDVNQ
jgi:hypothetical protein